MKNQIEIYNLLTKKAFIDEYERKYLDKTIQNQYEINSARTTDGKITRYRSMRELPQEIKNKKPKFSEAINREQDVKYKFKSNQNTIEIIIPKEMIEQGKNTRYDFQIETIEEIEQIHKTTQKKYIENLRIKKSIAKMSLTAAILVGSVFGTIKFFDNLNERERKRQLQRDKYSTYYDYYKDTEMSIEKYEEMIEAQRRVNQYSKTK